MNATELLEKQHDEVKKLFDRLEDADESERTEVFEELAAKLVAHDAIERQIFYPACERAMGTTDRLGEALVEHGVVEFMLYEADQAQERDDFKYKCIVLREVLEHHIDEEEDEFFPAAKKALDDEKLEELGKKMLAKFKEALGGDFRKPLHENLKQVLAGTIKPAPNGRAPAKNQPQRRAPSPRSSR